MVSVGIQHGSAESCVPILGSGGSLQLLTEIETFLSYAEIKNFMIAGQAPDNSFTAWQNLPLGVYCVSKRTAGVCQTSLLEAACSP